DGSLLDFALARGQHHVVASLLEVADADQCRHPLLGLDVDEVDDWRALGSTARVRDFVRLQLEDAAAVGKEKDAVVGAAHYQLADDVLFARDHAGDALAATALHAIGGAGHSLDVAAGGDGDGYLFVGDQVLIGELGFLVRHDVGPALVTELLL